MESTLNSDVQVFLIWPVLILPLISFLFVFVGKRLNTGNLALFHISVSFILSVYLFLEIWDKQTIHVQWTWFSIGNSVFKAGILLNNLSVLMMVLVSGIATLVHIYSRSYMKGDPNIHRYWAYLGLFCFSMLGLVVSDNLLLIYLFWELVGFSSYLLIGFWYTKESAAKASKKAFIINRIGDLGFLTGIMIIFSQFKTLDVATLFAENGLMSLSSVQEAMWISGTSAMPAVWLTIAGISFFIGAMAKSAQFPFHTWLPDAMEGPTSVSSLIHAATMVAAGVFLIARIYPVFNPLVLDLMVVIGTFTAFMAATIAITQNDIKRILAYSTVSQLGFMIMALGIGAYSESIFHLSTHAFFKCLLFLSAGAVIHEMHHSRIKLGLDFDHQDIRLMGGLRKKMPVTFICMALASAALIGLPLSSGFLSKDAMIIKLFEWSSNQAAFFKLIPLLILLSSAFTAFYISRLIFKVFIAKPEGLSAPVISDLREAPGQMTYVLLVLALLSSFLPFSFNPFSYESSWLWSGFRSLDAGIDGFSHLIIPIIVNSASLLMILLTYRMYVLDKYKWLSSGEGFLFRFTSGEWYLNQFQSFTFVKPVELLARLSGRFDRYVIDSIVDSAGVLVRYFADLSRWTDRYVIDGMVNGSAALAAKTGSIFRMLQSGKLQHYLLSVLIVLLTFLILTFFI